MPNSRSIAKITESLRVKWICEQINTRTPLGIEMISQYQSLIGKEIDKVNDKGTLKDHYDILIYHADETCFQCEEKGTDTYQSNFAESEKPWSNSVQFYNGLSTKFSLSRKYLRFWYDINVLNEEVNTKYELPTPPSFTDWLSGGPDCMTDPKSDYSIQLKKNFKAKYPNSSMNGYGRKNSDSDYRIPVNQVFLDSITPEDKTVFIQEVQDIYDLVMKEKHVWLQTSGQINQEFSFRWVSNIIPQKIKDVEIKNGKDITFRFILEDDSNFHGIMRWGKGCGFSCFRIDLK